MTAGLAFGTVLVLILGGVWIAFALLLGGIGALWPEMGSRTLSLVSTYAHQTVTTYTFTAVPLFVFMGELMNGSTLGRRLFRSLGTSLRGLPGGLLQVNILASGIFAASSGSSVAAAATLGPMAYREQVAQHKLKEAWVLGSLAAGGTLGVLVPPSIMLIVYGAITGTSVGALFAAGIGPGILSIVVYMAYIFIRDLRTRGISDVEPRDSSRARSARLRGLASTWPFALLAVAVLGSIYTGVATPTESASIGVLLTAWFAVSIGGMKLSGLFVAARRAARTTATIVLIVIGANVFSALLARSDSVSRLTDWAGSLTTVGFLVFVCLLYLLLGAMFDGISIMLVTLPFLMPAVAQSGISPVLFGILAVMLIEVGLVTPPVGINLFVMQGVTGAPLANVVRGIVPFLFLDALRIVLVLAVPGIALWIPSLLAG